MTDRPRNEPPSVLVADDDPSARNYFYRLLERAGYLVRTAASGEEAKKLLREAPFDVVVSDITMPGVSGIDILRAVRAQDLDVAVILVTGNPNVDTAVDAVHLGALRYLRKPVESAVLLEAVKHGLLVAQVARAKRAALASDGRGGASDVVGLQTAFERALAGLWMAFQPIVSHGGRNVYAFEALMRSDEPALPNPGAVLDAAERLGQLPALGRRVRNLVAAKAGQVDAQFFINLHPRDLEDDELYATAAALAPNARRVVFEITERAHLDEVGDLRKRLASLRELGYRIALDDLGAGYAGLTSFLQLRPDIVKLDMGLVRGVCNDDTKRRLVASVTELCRGMNIAVVAEGIEDRADHMALLALGVDLLQGYAFARPQRELVGVSPEWFLTA